MLLLRISSMNRPIMAACLTLGMSALPACASSPKSAPSADFSGNWSVKWCDRSNPKLDCGGFNLSLVQEGTRLCGDFGGALVNLRQIDDGQVVGTVVGSTAVLTIQSNRNGSISLARAELHNNTLNWQVVDEVRQGDNGDTDVISTKDELKREPSSSNAGTRTCSQITDNSKD